MNLWQRVSRSSSSKRVEKECAAPFPRETLFRIGREDDNDISYSERFGAPLSTPRLIARTMTIGVLRIVGVEGNGLIGRLRALPPGAFSTDGDLI